MVKKRRAYVHVGLGDRRDSIVGRALDRHTHALLELGVKNPATGREELLRAGVELVGGAERWSLDADEVAGSWRAVCGRAARGRDTVALSQPLLARADADAVTAVARGLDGLELHVVVTAHTPDARTRVDDPAYDLAGVLARWAPAVERPQHVHVVVGGSPAETWRAVGRVVGFGTASLRLEGLEDPVSSVPAAAGSAASSQARRVGTGWCDLLMSVDHDLVGDPEDLIPRADTGPDAESQVDPDATSRALDDALLEIERLTMRNEGLAHRLAKVERKRAKLKRRLREARTA